MYIKSQHHKPTPKTKPYKSLQIKNAQASRFKKIKTKKKNILTTASKYRQMSHHINTSKNQKKKVTRSLKTNT